LKPYQQRAAAILRRLEGIENPVVAEIGVAVGNLSEELLRQRSDLHLVMVDNWLPESEQPEAYQATGDTFAHVDKERADRHRANATKRVKHFNRAQVVEMRSVEAADEFEGEAFDLVFIDADHSYEGVKADIEAWFPKVKEGGYISGHDYENTDERFNFGVTEAVDEFCEPELDINFTWFHRK